MVESTRRQYEEILSQKESDFSKREAALAKERDSIDEKVAAELKVERKRIAAEESKKARPPIGGEVDQKTKELAELQQVLKERDAKLTEAQNAQAELIRKQRDSTMRREK